MKITNLAIENRTSVFVLLAVVIIAGLVSYLGLPVESFPQIKQPVVIVAAPYPGVSPEDMETLVAQPLEQKLKEISKVKKMTSSSSEGYTNITVEFEPEVDIDEAVQRVRDKVSQAKSDLPDDLDDPIIQEINFENIPIMLVSLTGEQSLYRLKEFAEDLEDKMEQIPGVLDVTITGGLEREVQVNINPLRLQYYGVSVDDIIQAIRFENTNIPGGSMEGTQLKYLVRVPGEYESVEEIKKTVVKTRNGYPVKVEDLAEVTFGFKEQENFSRLDGKPVVTLSIQKRSGENIIAIADQVKALLEKEKSKFPPNTEYVITADQSKDIRNMVRDLENNIIAGLLLVVFVLYFFMGARNGLIVGIAIPLSMLLSFTVLSMLGYTLNMIVLFSLILALGMLVDNAIVIVENIYRHHEEGKPLLKAGKEAVQEVGMAVITSTITTLLAFAPLLFWTGIIGEFMKFLPVTLIITLSSSLVVAMIFNPVISVTYMKLQSKEIPLPGDKLLNFLIDHYERTLRWVLHHKGKTLGYTALAFLGMIIVYSFANHGTEFFPDTDPAQAWIMVEAPNGTKLEVSDQIIRTIEGRITDTPDMKHYVAEIGKSSSLFDMGMSSGTSHKSKITIDFIDRHLRSQNSWITVDQLRQKVTDIPGAKIDVTKPQEGPPTGPPVEIQLKGEDFRILKQLSDQIMDRIKDVPGITELKDDYEQAKPELRIKIDREKAALLQLNTSVIASTIRTAINGTKASDYRIGQDEYDITVRFKEEFRKNYDDILNLTVFHEGTHIPLSTVAGISVATGLGKVNHVDGNRVLTITANALGRSGAEVLKDVKERLKNFTLPAEYSMTFAGQNKEQEESQAFLGRALLIALLLIFFVLVAQFDSITLPFVILTSVVLSLFGVLFGLLVMFKPFGIIMTGIGIISLAGVVVNNAIVLIDYIQKLRANGMSKREAIVLGGKTRLRPVLLTAITTILGLIPLTFGINIDFIGLFKGDFSKFIQFGVESSQWWGNMGVAVIFGLGFSTALTLIIVPALYDSLADLFVLAKEAETESGDSTAAETVA